MFEEEQMFDAGRIPSRVAAEKFDPSAKYKGTFSYAGDGYGFIMDVYPVGGGKKPILDKMFLRNAMLRASHSGPRLRIEDLHGKVVHFHIQASLQHLGKFEAHQVVVTDEKPSRDYCLPG